MAEAPSRRGDDGQPGPSTRVRREPPVFRRALVARTEPITPRLVRVTVGGPELVDLEVGEPAASVRLLIPSAGSDELVLPTWEGNEFLFADGTRPVIRTLTPVAVDAGRAELDLDVVLHEGGPLSDWVQRARPGSPVAVSGPGRGYAVDPAATSFVLAGDETAVPAIRQVIARVQPGVPVTVLVEVAHPDARSELGGGPRVEVRWLDREPGAGPGDALVAAVRRLPDGALGPGARIWAAGEAAAVQAIRRHLFEDRGVSRSQATVRGYWKRGRAEGPDDGNGD